MPRPPAPIGTFGKIRFIAETNGATTARASFRDYDGLTRDVERTRPTKGAAERALKEALRDRARITGSNDLTPESKVKVLAERWLGEFRRLSRSPNTIYNYERMLNRFILPGLGELRLRELTVGRVERFLRTVEDNHGPSTAKMVRSVLSGMGAYGAQHDAMDRNPVRDTGAISVAAKQPKALALAQVKQLLAYLTYDPRAIARDLLALVEFIAATGVRRAEALGVQWDAVDFAAGTVSIRAQVIRVVGTGLVLKRPKSDAGVRVLELPRWALRSLELRKLTAWVPDIMPTVAVLLPNGSYQEQILTEETLMVFPSRADTPRDPRNVDRQLKDAYEFAGLDATTHVFRKTVLTAMDQAGLSARAAADQAGHSHVSTTQNSYFGRKVASTGAASVLEGIGD